MKAVAIIPARLGSTRFPEKALAADTGKPLVVHVCERAGAAKAIGRVVVATDAEEIARAVRGHGFEAVLTGEHDNGTSRVAEAASALKLETRTVIVNVQGDEPEIDPGVIDAAILSLGIQLNARREAGGETRAGESIHGVCGTVAAPFSHSEDPSDPNIVKAVTGVVGPGSRVAPALYFTRAAAPYPRDDARPTYLKHIGIYAYALGDLLGYLALPPSPLEQTEKLEQLRWLENGLPIAVAIRPAAHHGIDTPEQYAAFVARWRASGGGVADR
jgi:3-deoxy-manno-octulosonate cytidylyltransferase (CMP-KDO synthetase)